MKRGALLVTALVLCVTLPDLVAHMAGREARLPSQRSPAATPDQARAYAEEVAAFQKRLDTYLSLREKVAEKVPEVSETGNPAKITAREQALGRAIAAARGSAQPGDLFGSLAPYLAAILAEDWTSRSAADRKALFSELPEGITLTVDHAYPPELPLLTVPPALLAKLPALPEEIEYRLISRHLLLRDRDANVVLDVLFNVIPR